MSREIRGSAVYPSSGTAPAHACNDAARVACRYWFQSLSPPGAEALAGCATPVSGSTFVWCGTGDTCHDSPTGGPPVCTCSGVVCAPTDVCVHSDADPTPRCVAACWALPAY